MANQYNKIEALVNELQRIFPDKRVLPAVRIGDKYLPIEWAYVKATAKKIRFVSFYLTTKGVYVRRSKNSESIYFFINNQSFRVSDHPSKHADHIRHQFIVKYDTCVVQLLSSIKIAHYKPDEYYG
jgi:hypothetical protein